MNIELPESLFDSIQTILKYQNTLLLKEIAKDKGWKLSELKKDYLKTENVSALVKKYNKKQKKINKKPEPEPEEVERQESDDVIELHDNEHANEVAGANEVADANEVANEVAGANEVANANEGVKESTFVVEIEDNNDLEPPKTIEIPEPTKKVKKKKIKKVVKDVEIRCHKYTIEDTVFYINVENDNAYDKNMEFVGRKVGNMINFNDDEV